MMKLQEKLSNLYSHTLRRGWSNYNFRQLALGTAIFLASMGAIYVTKSDRISYEVRDFKRVTPNLTTNDKSGLSINGISVDYVSSNGSYLTLDDFITTENNTQIVFTWTPKNPANLITVGFGGEKADYVSQMTFDNDPLSVKSETKELVFGNKDLNTIIVDAENKTYTLLFKSEGNYESDPPYNGANKK